MHRDGRSPLDAWVRPRRARGLANCRVQAGSAGSLAFADGTFDVEDGRFKHLAAMVVDPVCGMAVEQHRAVQLEQDGRDLRFCFRGCRSEFQEEGKVA